MGAFVHCWPRLDLRFFAYRTLYRMSLQFCSYRFPKLCGWVATKVAVATDDNTVVRPAARRSSKVSTRTPLEGAHFSESRTTIRRAKFRRVLRGSNGSCSGVQDYGLGGA